MRVTYNDTLDLRNEVDKLFNQVEPQCSDRARELRNNIMSSAYELARIRKPAPEWVDALVHAKKSLEKRDPDSTAITHIDQILEEYHDGKFSESLV